MTLYHPLRETTSLYAPSDLKPPTPVNPSKPAPKPNEILQDRVNLNYLYTSLAIPGTTVQLGQSFDHAKVGYSAALLEYTKPARFDKEEGFMVLEDGSVYSQYLCVNKILKLDSACIFKVGANVGIDGNMEYVGLDGNNYHMEYKKGILVKHYQI